MFNTYFKGYVVILFRLGFQYSDKNMTCTFWLNDVFVVSPSCHDCVRGVYACCMFQKDLANR